MNRIIQGDCREVLRAGVKADCVFADPPDNIGLDYDDGGAGDRLDPFEYQHNMTAWLWAFTHAAPVVWFSFNARHTAMFGFAAYDFLKQNPDWEMKPCVQTFTFGQQRKKDLSNCHRPLWRFMRKGHTLHTEDVLVESWRQQHGDKRAAKGGKVPSDVFDFPRVTGNSKQRRKWHPTQLHEGLVERCIRLATNPGDTVLDPFAGTGTTLRVCSRIDRQCILIERNETYAENIAFEHELKVETKLR